MSKEMIERGVVVEMLDAQEAPADVAEVAVLRQLHSRKKTGAATNLQQ